ncbi:MAG: hypothetical protein JW914_10485 [Syntrophaceae bacterium]|nr:hypothetical protein [Syntrophaceae bacterium]
MPLADKSIISHRLGFHNSISKSEIKTIILNKDVKTLQTSSPVNEKSWKLINENLLSVRPDIEIRIFGHYSEKCDLSVLKNIPNVKKLSVDCLMNASNVDTLDQLNNLEKLSVGIYSLENFSFLYSLPNTLTSLFLGTTKSKKPSLNNLRRFTNLKELYIEGQQKDIEAVGALKSLEKLTLRSVSPKDISFIAELKKLWSLDIKLGGIKDFNPIKGLANLKYLELWQVRDLSNISFISTLSGLQCLFMQSLRNVKSLPDLSGLTQLRRVYLENMKGLHDISGVLRAPALEEYIHVCAENMSPEQYEKVLEIKTLKSALFLFGSDKKNIKMEKMMNLKGINEYRPQPFHFI